MADISGKAAFNAALEKVRKVAPQLVGALQEKEYMGHQIYMLRRGDAAAPGQPPRQATAAFVATDKEFIFSSRLEALETHLRRVAGGGPSLADRPEFQEGMKALPAQDRVMVLFTDPSRQAEFLLTVLREGQLTPVIEMLKQDPDTAEVVNLFDLSLLPDPADVTKHLSATAACALTQPDGLMVISKSRAKAP
jgi:hypothetical protein